MNNEQLFRLITVVVLVSALSISGYYRRKAERQGGKLDKSQGQGLLVVLRLIALVGVLPLIGYLINPAWVAWARFELPDWVRWIAAFCGLSMIPAIYWLFSTIGNNISPTQATRQNHQLVTSGPYRWIRHPLYTFGGIALAALTGLTTLWWLGIVWVLGMSVLLWRTGREEANLIARFGDEYRQYMQRTGRYWPKVWRPAHS